MCLVMDVGWLFKLRYLLLGVVCCVVLLGMVVFFDDLM